jgi:hypothetical protein
MSTLSNRCGPLSNVSPGDEDSAPYRHDGDTSSARFAARYGALVLLGSACLRRAPIGSYDVPRSLFGSGDAIPVTYTAWVVPFCRRQSDATSEALAAVG